MQGYAKSDPFLRPCLAAKDKDAVRIIETDPRRSHIAFSRIETLRITFAKHEGREAKLSGHRSLPAPPQETLDAIMRGAGDENPFVLGSPPIRA